MDPIRIELQRLLDLEKEGWSVAHYATMVGIDRVSDDGTVETATFVHAPDGQADYMTGGLLIDGAKRVVGGGSD